MMRRYAVPAELREGLWTGLDPRLRRYLRVGAVIGVVLALLLMLIPARKPQHEPRRILERRAARLITPKKTPAPRKVQTPSAPKARPRPKQQAKPKAEKAPSQSVQPKVSKAAKKTPRKAQQARKDPSVGKKGREAAQSVTRKLEKTTAGIDNLLSSVNGMVPTAGGPKTGTKSSGAAQNYARAAGRKSEQLASIDGALEAQGAGKGGSSQGVSREGVSIVDDGVRTMGDAADVWGRDTASLMAVVQRYKAGVKFCYDNALKKTPHLNGKITLQMDIDPSGRISSLSVASDSIGNRPLQKCISAQVKKWRFPKVDAGTVRFTLPLVFSPPE